MSPTNLATEVRFDDTLIQVTFTDGRVVRVPLARFPSLRNATREQRQNCRIIDGGTRLQWPELNEELSIFPTMAGTVFLRPTRSLLSGAPVLEHTGVHSSRPVPPNSHRQAWQKCPTCKRDALFHWFTMHGNAHVRSHWFFKAYCCECQRFYERVDSADYRIVERPEKAPSHERLVELAREYLDRAVKSRAESSKRAKSWVSAPAEDPRKPRFSQFFDFVCPLCSERERVGLWHTSKTCAGCGMVIRIYRGPL